MRTEPPHDEGGVEAEERRLGRVRSATGSGRGQQGRHRGTAQSYGLQWTRDGRRFAFVVNEGTTREIWALENLLKAHPALR